MSGKGAALHLGTNVGDRPQLIFIMQNIGYQRSRRDASLGESTITVQTHNLPWLEVIFSGFQ